MTYKDGVMFKGLLGVLKKLKVIQDGQFYRLGNDMWSDDGIYVILLVDEEEYTYTRGSLYED